MKAHYSLQQVQSIVREGKTEQIHILPKRSTFQVIRTYAATGKSLTIKEANEFILKGLLQFTEKNFLKSQIQWDCVVDIYGLIFDAKPWFVKFYIEEGELVETSFHPPEKTFTTTGGIKIPKGE